MNRLTRKLENFAPLSEDNKRFLDDVTRAPHEVAARTNLVRRALWWATLVDEAVLREWLVNIGQREAPERVAHILCELLLRLRAVGLADGDSYELPITQEELGDTLGLSTVYVNRTLQALRAENLITLKSGHVVILDQARLFEFSGFNPNYLHLPTGAAANRIRRPTPAT